MNGLGPDQAFKRGTFGDQPQNMQASARSIIRSRSGQLLIAMSLILAVVWIARFQRSSEFGLYEDDWTRIPKAVDMSLKELIDFVANDITNFRGSGRPLHHSSIYVLSFLGWNLGGMQGMYFLGFVIISLNAILFYLLLLRVHSHQFAIVGVLAFVLYSADTTQAFLTHSFGLHTATTLFLLASHSYISEKFTLSYGLILLSLLTYETPYLLFMAVPLFCHPWDKGSLRVLARHLVIMAMIFIGVFLLRLAVGELEGQDLSAEALLSSSIRHMVQGPIWSLGAYRYRSIDTYWSLDAGVAVIILLSIPVLFLIINRWAINREVDVEPASKQDLRGAASEKAGPKRTCLMKVEGLNSLLKLMAIGPIMLVLAYPLTFTTEPYLIYGRVTRSHFAAAAGSSILIAAVWMIVTATIRNEWFRAFGTFVLALAFAIMLGFGQVVQRDYARAWIYQREFWGELLAIVPDAGEDKVIIVHSSGLRESVHIAANTWNMPRVLERILEFPEHWDESPSVYRMQDGWLVHLQDGGGNLLLDSPAALTPRDHVREVSSSEMILIITDGGMVARQYSPIVIDGDNFPLSSPSAPILPTLPKKTLYDVLIPDPTP